MSRRDRIQMSDEEVRKFLEGSHTIIVNSVGKDGVPHPIPMWFAIGDDGTISMTTYSKSQKIRNLEREPRVALLAEAGTAYTELRGVVVYGDAELVRDVDAVADILLAVSKRQGADATGNVREQMRRTAEKRTGIRVRPQRVVSWDHRKLGGVY